MVVTRAIGIRDPGLELLIVRLIQAAYSILVVYFVYRILDHASGREGRGAGAILGGLLAATFFVMPVTAVHQLEESVCQVPLLASFWWWTRSEEVIARRSVMWGLASGVALGLALILRFPLIGLVAAFVAVALLQPRPVTTKLALLAGLLLIFILQGYSNALINHEWWFSFKTRLGPMLHPRRMALESEGYPDNPPWHYILTLLAALIPPASVLLLAAAVKGGTARPFLLPGIGVLAFLVSHSLIANKQERFLLPILPVLIILIVAGLPWLAARVARPIYRGMWWYFWIVNTVLLVIVTFSFSKKDRVEPLLTVYRRHDATGVLVAQYNGTFSVPEYYLGRDCAAEAAAPHLPVNGTLEREPPSREFTRAIQSDHDCRPPVVVVEPGQDVEERARGLPINYVIDYSDTPEADRVFLAGVLHRNLTLLTVIQPSLTDRLAHAINPRHNRAHTAAIYTTS